MMTKFNEQTNTCFTCGMGSNVNNSQTDNNNQGTSTSIVSNKSWVKQADISQGVWVLGGIDNVSYDDLDIRFKTREELEVNSKVKPKFNHASYPKKKVYLTLAELTYDWRFLCKVSDLIVYSCVAFS